MSAEERTPHHHMIPRVHVLRGTHAPNVSATGGGTDVQRRVCIGHEIGAFVDLVRDDTDREILDHLMLAARVLDQPTGASLRHRLLEIAGDAQAIVERIDRREALA